jgi:hypothetical protein
MRMIMITTTVFWGRTFIFVLQPVGHRIITSNQLAFMPFDTPFVIITFVVIGI